jgi:4-nitrophenyl phosphatase
MLPKLILLDADGVVWRGNLAIPGAAEFILRARRAGCRPLLVSNNAGPDRIAYEGRCQRLGLPFAAEDIFSVNHLCGPYLRKHHPGARALVIGSEMLLHEMRRSVEVERAEDWLARHGLADGAAAVHDLKAVAEARFDAVVMGIDAGMSYLKLALACSAVQHGARLIGANPDYSFPVEGGIELPGNGSFVELVAGVCGVRPTYLGKPELHLLELIEEETGIGRAQMVMVGDRVETDIQFAANAGIPAYLVLTGVTPPDGVPADLYAGAQVAADLAAIATDLGLP